MNGAGGCTKISPKPSSPFNEDDEDFEEVQAPEEEIIKKPVISNPTQFV